MKRAAAVIASAVVAVICLAGTALADYPPQPGHTPTVLGKHAANDSTAFTGANLTVGLATLAALVFLGLLTLGLARRRAAARG